jgi:anthranilate phosphoribosyltransferase
MVALNAGALLMTAGLAESLKSGVEVAKDVLASGAAYKRLQAFAEVTND